MKIKEKSAGNKTSDAPRDCSQARRLKRHSAVPILLSAVWKATCALVSLLRAMTGAPCARTLLRCSESSSEKNHRQENWDRRIKPPFSASHHHSAVPILLSAVWKATCASACLLRAMTGAPRAWTLLRGGGCNRQKSHRQQNGDSRIRHSFSLLSLVGAPGSFIGRLSETQPILLSADSKPTHA